MTILINLCLFVLKHLVFKSQEISCLTNQVKCVRIHALELVLVVHEVIIKVGNLFIRKRFLENLINLLVQHGQVHVMDLLVLVAILLIVSKLMAVLIVEICRALGCCFADLYEYFFVHI